MSIDESGVGLYISGFDTYTGGISLFCNSEPDAALNLYTSGNVYNPYIPPPTGNTDPAAVRYAYATSLYIESHYTGSPNVENSLNLYLKTIPYDDYANSLNLYINGPRAPYDVASGQMPLYISTINVGYSPDTITGLTLWLDAYENGNFAFSSSNNIETWIDKSSHHNDFKVKTYNSPTYDSANKIVNFTNTQTLVHHDYYINLYDEYTAIIVAKNMGTGVLLGGVSDNESSFYASAPISALGINEATKLELESYMLSNRFYHKIGGFTYGSTQPIPHKNGIYNIVRTSSNVDFYYNARYITSNTISDPLAKFNFGSLNGYLDGESLDNIAIQEILIYNRKLNDDEIQNVNSYLYTKWNTYTPRFESVSLFVRSETVGQSSGALNLYINRPEYAYIPLVICNRINSGSLPLQINCATYKTSGITAMISGADMPTSGISLYAVGNSPTYTGINGLYS